MLFYFYCCSLYRSNQEAMESGADSTTHCVQSDGELKMLCYFIIIINKYFFYLIF